MLELENERLNKEVKWIKEINENKKTVWINLMKTI